jgi:hypothetical protein
MEGQGFVPHKWLASVRALEKSARSTVRLSLSISLSRFRQLLSSCKFRPIGIQI